MPQVPGLVPDQIPSGYAPEVNVNVPVDAFGGAVGHALQGLGGAIEGAGDKIFARAVEIQNQQNETEAKNADAQFMTQAGIMHAEFTNREGLNASPEALAKHIEDVQKVRQDMRANLSNPAAQKMFDGSSMSFMGRTIFSAAGHSGQQMKVAANNASDARIATAKNAVGDMPGDEINARRMYTSIASEIRAKGINSGWSEDQIKAETENQVGEAIGHRVLGLAKTNAPAAQRLLDDAQKSGNIPAATAEKVQASVTTAYRDQGARIISNQVLSNMRNGTEDDKPVQEYVDAAMQKADELNATNDPMFRDFVRSRVVTDYNQQKAINTDADNANSRVLGQALLKGDPNGNLPTSIEQLKASDPAVSAAWDAIARNPQKQQAILHQLERNAKEPNLPTNSQNMQLWHQFRGQGMAGTDEERAAFMARNFATEPNLTNTQKTDLLRLQDQLKHRASISANDDPRTARALTFLRPDLEAAGITPRGGEDNRKDYYTFVGALQDQLDQYARDNPGKLPKMDEIRTMGSQLMQEQITSKGWLWDSKEPAYKLSVPDDAAKEIKADPYWQQKGITPNDNMVARIYRAQQFKERYGGSAKEPTNVQFPPNTVQ
jgi:hypothetical protein